MHIFRFLLLAFGLLVSAQANELPPAVLTALKQAQVPLGNVGIEVREVNARSPLISLNAEKPMNPASVMKLLTTYAGLELLGPAYSWKTEAWLTGELDANGVLHGDLILKGSGDPKLSLEQFWLWLRELRNRGLREIEGDLVLDRSVFDLPPFDPAAFDNDPLRPYNGGADALLLNGGVLHLRLVPNGRQVGLLAEPPLEGLALDNRLRLAKSGDCGEWDDKIRAGVKASTLTLEGDYAVSCGERNYFVCPLPMRDYVSAAFRSLWKELGGALRGGTRDGVVPDSARLLSTHVSPPLSEVIRDINKYSNNVMARQLFLTLGLRDGTPTSIARSTQAMQAWLESAGLAFPELLLENGSGLSRQERITPQHLAQLLQMAARSPYQPEFEASLPIVGVDGTLKKRFLKQAVAGHAHLKSGTLDEARAIAGYVQARSGRQWIVVFIINQPGAAAGRAAQDALIDWLQFQ
ncbi:MAG: D-alanyl-D-alanine carboxypeptidase/D-alanyl-D-alanine-endopeptidase [Nitrosomonadales bacterium]|nr:D-alanyl-D-alanine carboxypeptidase/D-alanyl-D-alanine-endopeptidase [Nitrosomonadales bacterium]